MGNEHSSDKGASEAAPRANSASNDRRSRYEVGESVDQSLKKRANNLTGNGSEDLTKSPSRRLDSSSQRGESDKARRN